MRAGMIRTIGVVLNICPLCKPFFGWVALHYDLLSVLSVSGKTPRANGSARCSACNGTVDSAQHLSDNESAQKRVSVNVDGLSRVQYGR